MIYPEANYTGVAFKMGWVASVLDGGDSREVVVDAFSRETLASKTLVRPANYSRSGRVEGRIYPRHYNGSRRIKNSSDLKLEAERLLVGTVATDETDTSGDYELSWTGGTGSYRINPLVA